jgi:endonuclease/exonuclease/phosphatase family metal-dependent hydrolase
MTIVNTPEGPLHLTNLHLGLVERERHWQTERLLNHPRFQGHADLPSLVVGDFNDWRNTLAEAQFAAHGFEQLTGPPKQFRSFPAFLPMLSLDKAFLRGGLRVRDTRLVRTWRAFWASDHLPLVIDFNLA